jgi:hypothetical protein
MSFIIKCKIYFIGACSHIMLVPYSYKLLPISIQVELSNDL